MGSQYSEPLHFSFRGEFSQGTVHAPFNVMDGTVFQVTDQVLMAGKGCGREPDQVLYPEFMCGIEYLIRQEVTVPEMMVRGNAHPVPDPTSYQGFFQGGDTFVTVIG